MPSTVARMPRSPLLNSDNLPDHKNLTGNQWTQFISQQTSANKLIQIRLLFFLVISLNKFQ